MQLPEVALAISDETRRRISTSFSVSTWHSWLKTYAPDLRLEIIRSWQYIILRMWITPHCLLTK